MMRTVARLRSEIGAALVEYALVAALIALVSFLAVDQVGHRVDHALAPVAASPVVPVKPSGEAYAAAATASATDQYVLAESPAGTITFVAHDGKVTIDSYDLDSRWRGDWAPRGEGVVVELTRENSDRRIRVSTGFAAGHLSTSVYEYSGR
ncbi:MAG: hypothetical protein QNJ77_11800 [Acidimicrobiia bacterium]|nr:hypothetical protein [Acidimicrobiia bacterium]